MSYRLIALVPIPSWQRKLRNVIFEIRNVFIIFPQNCTTTIEVTKTRTRPSLPKKVRSLYLVPFHCGPLPLREGLKAWKWEGISANVVHTLWFLMSSTWLMSHTWPPLVKSKAQSHVCTTSPAGSHGSKTKSDKAQALSLT